MFPSLEARLVAWIKNQREQGFCVNRRAVRLEALRLKEELGLPESFSASTGLITKFMIRNGLGKRRVTR